MQSIDALECCGHCPYYKQCTGCISCEGHPLGIECIASKYINQHGMEAYHKWKQTLIQKIKSLDITGLNLNELHLLHGFYVNLAYPIPSGQSVKLLDDHKVYLGNQIEIERSDRCYGVVCDDRYLLICEYGCNGTDPELILFQKYQSSLNQTL